VQYFISVKIDSENNRIIALVDMNAFLASVEEGLNPAFRNQPVIVGGLPGERGIVICANYVARNMGVKFGTIISEAFKIIPDAVFIRGETRIYQDYWDRVCSIFYDFTPQVEPVSMDEAYLDLTGCVDNSGEIEPYMTEMKARVISSTGLRCSVGAGSSKTIAKIASNMEKPDGLMIIPSGDESRFLATLPIRQLPGVGWRTEKVLNDFGVTKIGDILKIPRKLLEDKFGIRGGEFHDYARGIDPRRVREPGKPKTITRETTFHEDIINKKEIIAHLYYLLERACGALRELKLKALAGKIKLRYSDFEFYDLAFQFERSSNVEGELYDQFLSAYNKLHSRRAALRLIGVSLYRFTPDLAQMNLFNAKSERLSAVSRSLDDIRDRYGYHSVVSGKTLSLSNLYHKRQHGYELRTASLTK
jgi:DNA polymerase-4